MWNNAFIKTSSNNTHKSGLPSLEIPLEFHYSKNARIDYALWRSWYVDNLSLSIDRYMRHLDPGQSIHFAFWLHDRYNGHICMARSLVGGRGRIGGIMVRERGVSVGLLWGVGGGVKYGIRGWVWWIEEDRLMHDVDADAVYSLQLRVVIRVRRANWNLRLWISCARGTRY